MSDTSHDSPQTGGESGRSAGAHEVTGRPTPEGDRRHPGRGDHDRSDRAHHPAREARPTPRRGESQLPHTYGKVSLEEILERNPKADRRRVRRSPKAQLFVTIAHWSMTLLLALNLLSGMRIGWGYDESPTGSMTGRLGNLLHAISPVNTMFGVNIIYLHLWSAFFMLLVTGMYAGYLFKSGTARKLSVTRADLRKLREGLRSRRFLGNKAALWSANVLVYWVAFAFIAVLTVTGFALYRLDLGIANVLGGYDFNRLVHAVVGYLLIPYVVVHATLQWLFGRFWTIFKAQIWRRHVLAGALGLLIAAPIAAGAYYLDTIPQTLTVPRIATPPVLDGDGGDPAWAGAQPVTFHTAKAANSPGHVSDVTVKAVHDGTSIYFQWRWADPDVSYKRYPLVKTEGGWKVLNTGLSFEQADESVYYEDKLSMYITDVKNGSCATTCHLGDSPKSALNEKHGLHYTVNGEVGDIWHWKSVRTNHMADLLGEPGYIHDQYFGPKQPIKPGERYTGGYFVDPNTQGGGYAYNFVKVEPKKPLRDTYVVPKYLPHNSDAVHSNADAATHELGKTWWLLKGQAVPYTKEADTYPVGTLIPNIIIEPFKGDEADIRGRAEWKDGYWTLESKRALDTHSKFDVAFVPGRPLYITLATYNRTQVRHSEHIKPVRAVLQP